MAVSELAVRLLILFFPGIICYYIVDALTVHSKRKPFQVFLFSYVYGMLSYAVYALCAAACFMIRNSTVDTELRFPLPGKLGIEKALTDVKVSIDFVEVLWVTPVAIVLALIISGLINRKSLHRLAALLGASSKFGEANVWMFALNSPQVSWATVRDYQHNLMYMGYIRSYSDIEPMAEILLTNVVVYNESTGVELYKADCLYLSRDKACLTVEFPNPPA